MCIAKHAIVKHVVVKVQNSYQKSTIAEAVQINDEKDEMEKVINMLKGFPKEDRIKIIEEIKDFVSNKAKQIYAKEVEEER